MALFDLADRPRAWIEVAWPAVMPDEGGGLAKEGEHKIELLVEIVDRDELARLFPQIIGDGTGASPTEVEIVTRLVSDWRQAGSQRKILDKGREVPFNKANAAKLIRVPMFGAAFTVAYIAAVGGKMKLREGNSSGLPGGGQADDSKPATTDTPTASHAIAPGSA